MSGAEDAFAAYFGLKEDLEALLGRRVDLVMAKAVRNPHFAASASQGAEKVYAADELRRSAVERQLEIVGEARKNVRNADQETAERIPDIFRIIGLRNILRSCAMWRVSVSLQTRPPREGGSFLYQPTGFRYFSTGSESWLRRKSARSSLFHQCRPAPSTGVPFRAPSRLTQ